MFKNQLEKSKNNIKWKNICWGLNVFMILIIVFISRSALLDVSIYEALFRVLVAANTTTILYQLTSYRMFGTYKENKFNIKKLPKEIEKSEDKIESLEKELKSLKEKCNYNENKLTTKDMIKLATVNYPERTNDETLVNDIQSPAKIKKITFNHNGTTK